MGEIGDGHRVDSHSEVSPPKQTAFPDPHAPTSVTCCRAMFIPKAICMNERFGLDFTVHLIGVAGPVGCGYAAYRSAVNHFVNGGLALRIGLVGVFGLLAVAMLVLYLLSGVQRYEVSDMGLIIHRPGTDKIAPWSTIRHLDLQMPHCVVFRSESSFITFTSIDRFPGIYDFLRLVHERSRCTLNPDLKLLLYGESNA
jgi:hypothetical protein